MSSFSVDATSAELRWNATRAFCASVLATEWALNTDTTAPTATHSTATRAQTAFRFCKRWFTRSNQSPAGACSGAGLVGWVELFGMGDPVSFQRRHVKLPRPRIEPERRCLSEPWVDLDECSIPV